MLNKHVFINGRERRDLHLPSGGPVTYLFGIIFDLADVRGQELLFLVGAFP